ncbi:unnamed protein product [Dicrocoelium dendriticum]|nr:unnamed protein product [Dicrocoelium dendriticum]
MDEFGSRINHSDTPNSRIVPFFYVPRGLCYSLLWPLQQIPNGDEVTVDYIEHIQDEKLRPLHLLPWQPLELYDSPIEHTYVLSEEFFTVCIMWYVLCFVYSSYLHQTNR